jgi:oxygen-independent coproporphyrinogen III oxidase
MMREDTLEAPVYEGYAYSYPHKTAYRHFEKPLALQEIWAGERRDALFLYIHIPFCEMRCGFCNLFTQVSAKESLVSRYLEKLKRQAEIVRLAIGDSCFVRVAIGGGTPTYLDCEELERLFDVAENLMGAQIKSIPVSIEVSPATVTQEKLALLAERGASRVSIGIQSFIESETRAIGRSQRTAVVENALEMIRREAFETLNIDLIYGMPEQTLESWLYSVNRALEYAPEEIYLYPLYVRPLTGLERQSHDWDDRRLTLYRAARDHLLREGYRQLSMRMFRSRYAPTGEALPYRCQEDDMLGLGCGARSYTTELHYCTEYAVSASGVREIIEKYLENQDDSFNRVEYGFRLNREEQRRRYVIQSLLSEEGLRFEAYQKRFNSHPFTDISRLRELEQSGLAMRDDEKYELTEAGLERSDQIGPALYSDNVRLLMQAFSLR